MIFKTSLDNLAKGVTIGVTLIFALIIIGQYAIIRDGNNIIPGFITFVLLFIHAIAFSLWSKSYELTAGQFIINRPLVNVTIDRTDIRSVELMQEYH